MLWTIEKIVSKGEYNYAVVREHPNATKHGYVLEHRVVVENQLGRLLSKGEIVHHINGNKKDNRLENLQVMGSREHAIHHNHENGHMVCIFKCPACGDIFEVPRNQTYKVKGSKSPLKVVCCSRSCRAKFWRKFQSTGVPVEQVDEIMSANLVAEERRYKTVGNSLI